MEFSIIKDLILITIIVVNIIDISGIVEHIEKTIQQWLKLPTMPHIHIIECSYCVNWWLSLLYLIITSNLTLEYITLVLILSLLTQVFNDILLNIKDILSIIINIPMKLIEKLS